MSTGFWYDVDECEWKPVSVKRDKPPRFNNRHTLMEALLEEIKIGPSETKLFAMLLASALAIEENDLRRDYWNDLCRLNVPKLASEIAGEI